MRGHTSWCRPSPKGACRTIVGRELAETSLRPMYIVILYRCVYYLHAIGGRIDLRLLKPPSSRAGVHRGHERQLEDENRFQPRQRELASVPLAW
jgi:hypothetical protein